MQEMLVLVIHELPQHDLLIGAGPQVTAPPGTAKAVGLVRGDWIEWSGSISDARFVRKVPRRWERHLAVSATPRVADQLRQLLVDLSTTYPDEIEFEERKS
jgi:hypothetical protein